MIPQADAPASTETPPAGASPEALDAAAAAATTGAVSPAAVPPSPEAPVPASGEPGEGTPPSLQDYVEDESLDLDSADLPDATKSELRTLRKQTKQYREAAAPWTKATQGWQSEDIETLRAALEQGPQNPEVVGEWMLKSAQSLLGDRFSELVGVPDVPEVGDVDEDGKTLGPEDVARLVEEKIAEREEKAAQDKALREQIASIEGQATELGFGPSHPLYGSLLFIARTKTDGDLSRAAELLRDSVGDPNTAAPNDAPAEAGHTPAAPEGGTPDGTKRPTSVTAAVNERLDKVLGNRRGFKDPLDA